RRDSADLLPGGVESFGEPHVAVRPRGERADRREGVGEGERGDLARWRDPADGGGDLEGPRGGPQGAVGARRGGAGPPGWRGEFRDLAAGRDAPDGVRDRVREPDVAVRAGRDGRRAEAPSEAEWRQAELGDGRWHPAVFQGLDLGPVPDGLPPALASSTEQRP